MARLRQKVQQPQEIGEWHESGAILHLPTAAYPGAPCGFLRMLRFQPI